MDHIDALAAAFAATHRGLLPGEQLRRMGFSPQEVRHRVETGRWIRLARDLFLLAGTPHTWQQDVTAAVFVGPPGTTVSFLSAGGIWHVTEPGHRPSVTVPRARSARNPLATVHRADLDPRDVTRVGGLPVTRIPRTLLDLATVLRPKALERAVDTALSEKRITPRAIEAAIERAPTGQGRKGVVALRTAMAAWTDPIKPGSAAEARLIRQIGSWGLADPARQHVVRDLDGVPFARLDLAWPSRLVGVEYDGVKFHNPRHIERDEGRQAALEALGWRVAHADRFDLRAGDRRLRDELSSLLRRAA
jgi:hypothetical protein